MRAAQVNDYWRTATKRRYDRSVRRIRYANVQGLGSGELRFHGGINVICGGNGAGKTTALMTLLGALHPMTARTRPDICYRLQGAELEVEVVLNGEPQTRAFYFDSESTTLADMALEVVWVDSAYDSPQMIDRFLRMTNRDELLASVEPRIADNEELKLLSYIVRKEYNSVLTYEVELADINSIGKSKVFDEESGTVVIPYFEVESGRSGYSTQSMGLGELSAHYIWWHLRRSIGGTIILIEEPETYLSPRSQETLLDVLASQCAKKGVSVVLTTHSPNIVNKVPLDSVQLLARSGGLVRIVPEADRIASLSALGIPSTKKGIILVGN